MDRAPRAPPFADLTCVAPELGVGIIILVGSARTMAAHIDVARRRLPWRGRVMVIRNAQRDVAVAQEVEDRALVPARVAELERIAMAARQHLQEGGEALAIGGEARRKLEQDGPGLGT